MLSGQHGWPAAIVTWMGAMRVPMKLAQGAFLAWLHRGVAYILRTKTTRDDAVLMRVIGHPAWLVLAWFMNATFSLLLPTEDTLDEFMAEREEASRGHGPKPGLPGTLPFLLAVAVAAGAVGCNTTPKRAAFNTLNSVSVLVDGAMVAWADHVVAGRATAEQQARVKAAYERYQHTILPVGVAVRDWPSGQDTPITSEVAVAAEAVLAIIEEWTGWIRGKAKS